MNEMKTLIRKSTATLLLAMIFTAGMMAQAGPGKGLNQNAECRLSQVIPDLTDDQIASLKDLRTDQLKSTQDYKNQMGEIKARQRTIWSQTPIDQKAAGKLIDEKSELSNKHQKQSLAHRAAISEILTVEQQQAMKQMNTRKQNFTQNNGRRNGNFHQGRRGQGQGQGRQFTQSRRGGQGQGQGRNNSQNAGQRRW